MQELTKQEIIENITGKLLRHFGKTRETATNTELYKAVALSVRDSIMEGWNATNKAKQYPGVKQLYYLSVEFLIGRSLASNILNKLQSDVYIAAMDELGLNLSELLECENEPGLGNGGLGRLAACFLDSLATLKLPTVGCGIRYEYGIFKQKIKDGQQFEVPDNWLDGGNVWEIERPEDTVDVRFGGEVIEELIDGCFHIRHTGYYTVQAVPYDMPIVGYDSDVVNTLRLWSARAPKPLDMDSFGRGKYLQSVTEKELAEVISKVLYPGDDHHEGKELRLKQHYFFTSATMQHIVRSFKRNGGKLKDLPESAVVQINDTHPALAIPELLRILMDEEKLDWDEAWGITSKIFAYTNHTIMSEALERWPVDLFKAQLPRIYMIITSINEQFCNRLWSFYPGQWERIAQMAIIGYGEVRMANLCVAACFKVNGVSQLHKNILKRGLFKDFFVVEPAKFTGITNGITHRRWLMLANPKLAGLLDEAIGDAWRMDPSRLEDLVPFSRDTAFLEKFAAIKQHNKRQFAKWINAKQGISVDTDSMFFVQSKRLHEYKRQLLTVLDIIYLYGELLKNPDAPMPKQTFIFGAKASAGYYMAKLIIRLIFAVGDMVERTPETRDKLKVVFVENYNVSAAEALIPATDISLQLSTAGKEASGTGNMKFMMNGAYTLGTLDGANVEMYEQLGDDNMQLFGYTADETEQLYRKGTYSAGRVYGADPTLRKVLDHLISGGICPDNPSLFSDIYHRLLFGDGGLADPYLVLGDFNSFCDAQKKTQDLYLNKNEFTRACVVNTAKSGVFSSDRTIKEYNDIIWRLSPLLF